MVTFCSVIVNVSYEVKRRVEYDMFSPMFVLIINGEKDVEVVKNARESYEKILNVANITRCAREKNMAQPPCARSKPRIRSATFSSCGLPIWIPGIGLGTGNGKYSLWNPAPCGKSCFNHLLSFQASFCLIIE